MMRVYPQPQPNVAGFPPQNGAGLPQQTAGFTAMPVSASVGASGPHPPYVMAVPAAQSIAQDPAVAEGLASPRKPTAKCLAGIKEVIRLVHWYSLFSTAMCITVSQGKAC